MATHPYGRLNSLVDRIFHQRSRGEHVAFDILRKNTPAVRALADALPPAPADSDDAWLQRAELRGPEAIVAVLEKNGFASARELLAAIFLDARCGLLSWSLIGPAVGLAPNEAVGRVLRLAGSQNAAGIVLATNDLGNRLARAPELRKMTMDLKRKGEAIDTFLLDHFVLTAEGWKRMFPLKGRERLT